MESFAPASVAQSNSSNPIPSNYRSTRYQADVLIIKASFSVESDQVSAGIDDLPKALSLSADEIVQKLNEMLKDSLPEGIESLKPEDTTPEATADRIVSQSTALFDAYAKQNPNLDSEELLNSFMDQVRKGIDQGYDEAFQILDGLGAFQFDGVKEGIEKTKALIEDKLKAFEAFKREELGLPPISDQQDVSKQVAQQVSPQVLASAGKALSVVA
ncbi:MAG: DUF5610 domain-containing protein [Oligoflexia bacterium]|nr:DUF5610 domain-containing protein [Oligoflexia bacterium]